MFVETAKRVGIIIKKLNKIKCIFLKENGQQYKTTVNTFITLG